MEAVGRNGMRGKHGQKYLAAEAAQQIIHFAWMIVPLLPQLR
jgi:hypothetical protein